MTTGLLYAEDARLFETEARVRSVISLGGIVEMIFDRTVFYPQGGGQPSDIGSIDVAGARRSVSSVEYRDGDVVHSIAAFDGAEELVGETASLRIDRATRSRNAALHTAGHLVSHVLERIMPSLLPIKGHHFPDAPYVEMIDRERTGSAELIDRASEALADAVDRGFDIESRVSDFEEISTLRPYLAVNVPKNSATRVVRIGEFVPVPCGGTHLASTAELVHPAITRIKRKKDRLKVSYQIGG